MEDAIVLYPSPGIGHLISMVELGKLIITHYPSFSIKILITTPPYSTGFSPAPYIKRVSITTPAITFHHLPIITFPLDSVSSSNQEALAFKLLLLNNPNVHESLQTISLSFNIRAFILDLFCTVALEVAINLKIPTFYYFTSGASVLASFLYFPTLHKNITESFKDLDINLDFPGLPPIPASDMPVPMLDRNDMSYHGVLKFSMDLPKSSGIIINTFESLEPRAIKAICDGICVPDFATPPIYGIGPLIAANNQTGGDHGDSNSNSIPECLTWLDLQPSKSVVFLCFGSMGLFSENQLKEIAIGLEKSGHRFLWVVRNPPKTEQESNKLLAPPEPDLDALLPEGFLERTKEKGLVVKSWAPQEAVLSRESVGGFVTHCGWNSVLEGICAGVPMVAWPLYAEQRLNRVIMVEEMKLALSMEEREDGFVTAEMVEKKVRELMESEEGKSLRDRTMEMRDEAKAAMREGGSSRGNLEKLAMVWKEGCLK